MKIIGNKPELKKLGILIVLLMISLFSFVSFLKINRVDAEDKKDDIAILSKALFGDVEINSAGVLAAAPQTLTTLLYKVELVGN